MPVGTLRAARRTRTLAGLDFEQRIFFNAHLCGLARESRGRAPHAPYPGDTRAHTWGQPKTPQRFWGDSREVRHRPTRPGRHPPGGTRPHGPAEQCAGTPLPGRTEAPSGFPARSRPSGGRLKGRPLLRPPCHPDVWGRGRPGSRTQISLAGTGQLLVRTEGPSARTVRRWLGKATRHPGHTAEAGQGAHVPPRPKAGPVTAHDAPAGLGSPADRPLWTLAPLL